MIVFPWIRSVGFRAATASSSVATLPMLVRSRPSRTRWTISLMGTIGLDDEVHCQAVNGPRLGRPYHRPDCAGGAVREDALPHPQATVVEQSLPRRQARDRQARAHREIDIARQRRKVAC